MVSCLKVSFCAVTILCAVAVIGLAGGGIWYSLQVKQLTDLRNYQTYQLDFRVRWPQITPYIFAAVGTFGLVIIFCGLCGIKSRGCLLTYSVCSFIFFLIVVGVGAMSILLAVETSEDFIRETLTSVFDEASRKPIVQEGFEKFETSLHCCGVDGPSNYYVRSDYRLTGKLPKSCHQGSNSGLNIRGCFEVAATFTKFAYYTGAVLCGIIAVLALTGVVFAVALVRRTARKEIN